MKCPICDGEAIEKRQDAYSGENILYCVGCNFHTQPYVNRAEGEYSAKCVRCARTTCHDKDKNCKVCGLHSKEK